MKKEDPSTFHLKSGESFAKHLAGSYSDEMKGLSLGKILKGYIEGDWTDAAREQKAMGSTPLSSGGILIPLPIAANIIDLARNKARTLQAGAITVPMSTATLKYGRQTQDVVSNWTPEAANIPLSAAAFDSVTFVAHKLACLVPIDNELLADTTNMDGILEASIAASMSLALDFAGLYGSGVAPVPQGLHGIVPALAAGGAPTYDLFLEAIEAVRTANFEPNAIIYSPRTASSLSRLKTTYGEYLQPPADFVNLQKLTTNQVPVNLGTGANESQAFVGQWDQLALGLRASVQIEVSREAAYFDGAAVQSAFSKDQTVIRAILRADWQPLHLNAFEEVTGILAS